MKILLAILVVPVLVVGYIILVLRGEKHAHCERCETPFEKPQRFAFCKGCWAAMGLKQ